MLACVLSSKAWEFHAPTCMFFFSWGPGDIHLTGVVNYTHTYIIVIYIIVIYITYKITYICIV